MTKKIIITGGGICGLTTAIALEKLGFEVEVYEAASTIKAVGAGLVLSTNAVKALDVLELSGTIIKKGHLLKNYNIAKSNGQILVDNTAQIMGKKHESIGNFSIHRAELHQILLNKLKGKVAFHTNKRGQKVEQTTEGVTLYFTDDTIAIGDYLIACDGINSPIRQQLLPKSLPRYAGYTCWRGVIKHNGEFNTEQATETWGKNGRFGVVPLSNNRIYWFACLNTKIAKDAKMKALKIEDLQTQYKDYHYPIPQVLAQTKQEAVLWNDIEDLKPIKQFAFNRILLAGDAAHATTPNMGQGACQAIEDAAVLYRCLQQDKNVETAFQQFEKRRIPRTTKVVETSWTIGKMAQWTNPIMMGFRNTLVSLTPQSISEKQMAFLFEVEF